MDDVYISLVGVIIGWFLHFISNVFKHYSDKKRVLKRNFYRLESIRANIYIHLRNATNAKFMTESTHEYEKVRKRRIINRFDDDALLVKHFELITSEIAEYYPIISLTIDGLFSSYLSYMRFNLEKISGLDECDSEEYYFKMLIPIERSFLISYLILEKKLLSIALKISPRFYFKYKRRIQHPARNIMLQTEFERGVLHWKVNKLGYTVNMDDYGENSTIKIKRGLAEKLRHALLVRNIKKHFDKETLDLIHVTSLERDLVKK